MSGRPDPRRMCVGCRETAPKRTLVRIVRSPAGAVAADPTGRAPGRGAYLHPRAECVRAAARRGSLGRALRAAIRPDEVGRLVEIIVEE